MSHLLGAQAPSRDGTGAARAGGRYPAKKRALNPVRSEQDYRELADKLYALLDEPPK